MTTRRASLDQRTAFEAIFVETCSPFLQAGVDNIDPDEMRTALVEAFRVLVEQNVIPDDADINVTIDVKGTTLKIGLTEDLLSWSSMKPPHQVLNLRRHSSQSKEDSSKPVRKR